MPFGLERLFGRRSPEDESFDESAEETSSTPKAKNEWRTSPELTQERALSKEQQEAVDTAAIRVRSVLDEIDSLRRIKKEHGAKTGVTYYDAQRIKGFTAFETVLEHGTPEQKIEVAVRVLHEYGTELQEKHTRALERLHKIDTDNSGRNATPGIVESVNTIGEEIQQLETDMIEIKNTLEALSGKA